MVVNNLVSIVQIYCRHLFPHTKWIICQLSLIKFQNIFDDASGMLAFVKDRIAFRSLSVYKQARKIQARYYNFLLHCSFLSAFGFSRCEIPTWINFKTGVSLSMNWHAGIWFLPEFRRCNSPIVVVFCLTQVQLCPKNENTWNKLSRNKIINYIWCLLDSL